MGHERNGTRYIWAVIMVRVWVKIALVTVL